MSPSLKLALEQIAFARSYTLKLLDAVPADDWLRVPPGGVSHIAWQVGHLAMAEYRLVLERVRGRQPGDERLISDAFLLQFGRNSKPELDPALHHPLDELRDVFQRVHQQALHELPNLPDDELDQPPLKPHALFTTKLGGLFWCAQHEPVHAGQIGLLRRQLGHEPLW